MLKYSVPFYPVRNQNVAKGFPIMENQSKLATSVFRVLFVNSQVWFNPINKLEVRDLLLSTSNLLLLLQNAILETSRKFTRKSLSHLHFF